MDDPQATTSMVPNGRRTPTPRTLSYGKRSGGRILEEEESPLIGECAHANGDYFDRTPARTTPAEIEDPLESASSEDEEPGATDAGTRGALGASSDAALLQSGKVSSNPGLRSRVSAVRRPGGALRKWQTESNRRGQRGQNPYRSSNLKRTETSHLNHAIWQRYGEGTASGSASSTSSDAEDGIMLEEDGETQEREDMELRRRKTREAQKQRKDSLLDRPDADERYRHFLVGNENYQTKGKVKKDGRLRITVNEAARTGYLAKTLGTAIHRMSHAKEGSDDATPDRQMKNIPSRAPTARPFKPKDLAPLPKLNIVVMVIGSRGDVQPFLRIGKVLKEDYGHRVRIATHPAYRKFVEEDSQLEFFSVGGDPSELMAFMVKNPGLIPTLDTVKSGEIGRRRAAMAEMFDGFWRACIDATDDERDGQNLKMMGSKDPFVADAIIANPPSFAHIHCAEALGIPLHLMFTFPYTPTQVFPHPLASIKKSNVDPGYTNFISYPMVEMMVWQGLGDLVNDFRVKTLNLDPVSTLWAPGATYRLHVPFTYLWSPGIVAKPKDWGPHIDISGFVYLSLASSFEPPRDLEAFLDTGEPPIYIGFGSIVVDDPQKFTQLIFDAVAKAGVRALVSKGWGGLGVKETPDNIFMLENTPHDWLFPRVKAAVIHGGAGTTAIALKCGLPTFIVPFFGDQHFWGKMVSSSDVGPAPVPFKFLTVDNLAEGIRYCLTAEAKTAAMRVAKAIEREGDGAVNACRAFHEHLNLRGQHTMRCSLLPDQIAAWSPKNTSVKLSPLAADILVGAGYASYKRLRLIRHTEWNDFEGPGEPITGIAGSLASTVRTAFSGVAGVPVHLARTTRKMRKARKSSTERPKGAGGTLANGNINEMANGTSQPVASSGLPASELDRQLHLRAPTDLPEEYAGDLAHGVGRTAYAIAKAPVDLSMALAQGFHNAPRLYGDDTVRRPTRVTGIRSGLRAARKEFAYGVYDGFTGVVRLPARGARSGGAAGFAKGAGMGLLGLVIKNVGAVVGPAGYALKGLVKQAERSRSPQKFVRRARIAQGQRAGAALSDAAVGKLERTVADGYSVMRDLGDAIREEARERGFAGQLDRVLVDTGVLFESVDVSRKALAALRRGESLESVLRPFAGKKRGGAIPQVRRTLNRRRAATLPARRDDGGQVGREPRARDGASKTEDRGPGLASASLSRSMTAGL